MYLWFTILNMAYKNIKKGPGRPKKDGELRTTTPVGILPSVLKIVTKDHGSLTIYVDKKLRQDGYIKSTE